MNSQNQSRVQFLSNTFLRERHLCEKWVEKDTTSTVTSFFSSTVMETTDFNAIPRTGKAIDFIYRSSLFEHPIIDLAGNRFTVQNSAARGAHRADASALEVSDAGISALLLTIGRDYESANRKVTMEGKEEDMKHIVEMGPDGYPMLFMKTNKKHRDQVTTEMKPYRTSFVRAALMVTSGRQEAQLQVCVCFVYFFSFYFLSSLSFLFLIIAFFLCKNLVFNCLCSCWVCQECH
jgi:hypothetical protein